MPIEERAKKLLFLILFYPAFLAAQNAVAPELEKTSALSVSRLPDLKLNDATIHKTVFNYETDPSLENAAKYYAEDNLPAAIEDYKNAAANSSPAAGQAAANLALIYLQQGNRELARKYADKAVSAEASSPLSQLVKIWVSAACGDIKQLRKDYENLFFLTSDFEYIAGAKIAVSAAEFTNKNYKEALPILQNLYSSDPYAISYAIFLMGRIAYATKDYKTAQTFFEQALAHDASNYAARKYLAMTEEKLKFYAPAWQGFASLYAADAKNAFLSAKLKKLSKFLKARPIDYMSYIKLSEIYGKTKEGSAAPQARIGLYAKTDGTLTDIKYFSFLSSSAFSISDAQRGEVLSGEAYAPKTIEWDGQNKSVSVKNKRNAPEFFTKRPFIISPKRRAAMQIKDVNAEDIFAAPLDDKELRGSLLVIPAENGMRLVNNAKIEDVLPAFMTSAATDIKRNSALEAFAIVLRTLLLKNVYAPSNADFDMPDYGQGLRFGGVNMQSTAAAQAAAKTQGSILTDFSSHDPNALADARFYKSCSTVSEEGTRNSAAKNDYKFSPLNLFRFMLSNPPADLYSAPEDPTLWSSVKWIYIVPLQEIEARLNERFNTGKLKGIKINSSSPYGRARKIFFSGSKNSVELDFKEANSIIAAGGLRSDFFFHAPIYKGNKIRSYIFVGSDTGNGEGLCLAGAQGLSKNGKTAREILSYYYPAAFKITEKWKT
jgi:SpoIID/LytB domain protein